MAAMGNVELSVPRWLLRNVWILDSSVDRTAHIIWLLSLGLNERYDYCLVRCMPQEKYIEAASLRSSLRISFFDAIMI